MFLKVFFLKGVRSRVWQGLAIWSRMFLFDKVSDYYARNNIRAIIVQSNWKLHFSADSWLFAQTEKTERCRWNVVSVVRALDVENVKGEWITTQYESINNVRLVQIEIFCRRQIKGCLTLYHTIPTFYDLENIVGKRENAGNQHFLLFPQCFLPFPKKISVFDSHLNCHLQTLSIWTGLKFWHLVKS